MPHRLSSQCVKWVRWTAWAVALFLLVPVGYILVIMWHVAEKQFACNSIMSAMHIDSPVIEEMEDLPTSKCLCYSDLFDDFVYTNGIIIDYDPKQIPDAEIARLFEKHGYRPESTSSSATLDLASAEHWDHPEDIGDLYVQEKQVEQGLRSLRVTHSVATNRR